MIDLSGKRVLVTGGSRGIGRACVELLSAAGARVGFSYRLERASAEQLAGRLRDEGRDVFAVAADAALPEDAEVLVDEAIGHFGGVDVLVNNAGIWQRSPLDELSDEAWQATIGTNLGGSFLVTRAVVPMMKEQGGGRLIFVSSTAGQRGEAEHAHYAASKAGLIALAKSLAVELAPFGITANCVAPGWTETEMTRETLDGPAGAGIRGSIPLARAGRPEEIAGAILFLASDLASYVNGEVLNVNGGNVLCG